MTITQENCTQKTSSLSRLAALAGAAIALPLAANAGTIITTPSPSITVSSTDTDQSYNLDINNDGVIDYVFTASWNLDLVSVTPTVGNSYVTDSSFNVIPLSSAFTGDPSATFGTGKAKLQKTSLKDGFMKGPWPTDGSFAYLGVQFMTSGGMVDGWVKLSATTPENTTTFAITTQATAPATFTIAEYGYVTSDTPEPSSLAMFALGAAGVAALRARRKRVN